MKKITITIIIWLIALFLLPENSLAACTPRGPAGCSGGQTGCSVNPSGIGTTHCCDTAQECTSLQNQQSTGNGVSDPRAGCSAGINTAIGCINVLDSPEAFLGDILKWSVGIGGGIAFLLIVYASFIIMTSAGNPERLKTGQELLTSAISGLILLVLSIFVLKFIGIDILGLDQFGFGQ